MRVAVLADVHANLPALEAVLAEVRRRGADDVLVLGDLVGYNAQPVECVARVRALGYSVVQGNHDHDAVHGTAAVGTHAAARQVQQWTREQLGPEACDYLAGLPNLLVHQGGLVAVHGCFLNERHFTGYVTSTMLGANLEAVAAHSTWPKLALVGHTHSPMVGWLERGTVVEPPRADLTRWPERAQAVLINPGAVGQPRDRDPRAAFAMVDTQAHTVAQCRVEYDVAAAQLAIHDAGLPAALAERLVLGV